MQQVIIPVRIEKFKYFKNGWQTFILHVSSENYYENQEVILKEFNRDTLEYTGRTLRRIISHIQDLNDGATILGLAIHDDDKPGEIEVLQRKIGALETLLSTQQRTDLIYRELYERDRFDERKMKSLDSEKEMNAILTEENEKLRARIKELENELKSK